MHLNVPAMAHTCVEFVNVLQTFLADAVNVMQKIWAFTVTWKPDAGLTIQQQRFATIEETVFVENASVIQGKIPMR